MFGTKMFIRFAKALLLFSPALATRASAADLPIVLEERADAVPASLYQKALVSFLESAVQGTSEAMMEQATLANRGNDAAYAIHSVMVGFGAEASLSLGIIALKGSTSVRALISQENTDVFIP